MLKKKITYMLFLKLKFILLNKDFFLIKGPFTLKLSVKGFIEKDLN